MKNRKNAIFWQGGEKNGRIVYNLIMNMASSFEKFTSDIKEWGDTRVQELRKAWEEQHPGEPYPETNGVGESVWSRDQLQSQGEKKSDAEIRQEGYEQAQKALKIAQDHAQAEAKSWKPWYPPEALMAWWVPDASDVPSTGAASVPEWASESPA
jgi:hypothetical protein